MDEPRPDHDPPEKERLVIRQWWQEEAGSDPLMTLRAKLKLWRERAREVDPA